MLNLEGQPQAYLLNRGDARFAAHDAGVHHQGIGFTHRQLGLGSGGELVKCDRVALELSVVKRQNGVIDIRLDRAARAESHPQVTVERREVVFGMAGEGLGVRARLEAEFGTAQIPGSAQCDRMIEIVCSGGAGFSIGGV
ncbi:MAG: hypothetical protein R3E03_03960 [Novosphingobium sp.]